ncbi:MAG: alpha-L-rhamnosidase [Firmicutes bacterium]|nr:alpha-L-rhamnosidase [Bacillota bacterium]
MRKKLQLEKVTCEYRTNPIGLDVTSPRLSWKIVSEERNCIQGAYRIIVAIDQDFTDIAWDSGKVLSDRSVHVEYDGRTLAPSTRYYYKVQVWEQNDCPSDWSETAFWETGLMDTSSWAASWITSPQEDGVCPLMRTTFTLKGKVKKARIYATALGLYELYLNGNRVGDWLFTPGWTAYQKRLQYQTYDITAQLTAGTNAVGALLGGGWYKGNLGWEEKKYNYGDNLALLLELHIMYDDGTEEKFTSDNTWKTAPSALLMSEMYNGETYDARAEQKDWSTPVYDDSLWQSVAILEHTKDVIIAQQALPVKVSQEIQPRSLSITPNGQTVLDFGQNMVGWVRFTVQGPEGAAVTLRHAEILDKDGNVYTDNLRNAKQTVRYLSNGDTRQTFEPHFVYQGFRYVEVVEYPGEVKLENFTGVVLHSAMEQTGEFSCSNELVNQLQHNIVWSQKGNFMEVPTDCPQRDERAGWTGDAQIFARTACFNMDVALFLQKWLGDVQVEQFESGGVPVVVPNILGAPFGTFSAGAWSDAAVICPWTLYLCYGDTRILAQHYESMKRYIAYITGVAENGLLWNSGFQFGDWLALDANPCSFAGATPNDFVATAFYAYSTGLVAKTAAILGKDEDARQYAGKRDEIIAAFRQEYFTPAGRLAVPTQTAHILALMFDLVEDKDRKRTIDTLVQYLDKNKWHLDTGFVGTPYLCHVLSRNGRADVAYKLLLATDYPSWLYQVSKGATTIWEHWDGIKEDGSFWSADMNSFNHYAYGAIGEWMYREAAGLDLDENNPGYKHMVIKPVLTRALSWVATKFDSLYGLIKSKWQLDGNGKVTIAITIPPNTTASVMLPYAKSGSVTESDQPLVSGALSWKEDSSGVTLEIGSGVYSFSYTVEASQIPDVPETKHRMPWE